MITSTIRRAGILALFWWGLIAFTATQAQESPHWSKTGCQACHNDTAPVPGAVNLNANDAESLCETCHGARGDATQCRHRTGLPLGDMTIDEDLQAAVRDGQIVCSTCHDIVYQCENVKTHYSLQNPGFLRSRTSRHTADYCFKCHDSAGYQKFNPHTIIAGDSGEPTCLFCHDGLPESDESGETDQIQVAFNMRHDLNDTCLGCHNVRPHPLGMTFSRQDVGWNHLVVPPDDIRQNMEKAFTESGTRLPLDPLTGKVFCGTCHNQHEFRFGDDDALHQRAIKNRLRSDNICQVCHAK